MLTEVEKREIEQESDAYVKLMNFPYRKEAKTDYIAGATAMAEKRLALKAQLESTKEELATLKKDKELTDEIITKRVGLVAEKEAELSRLKEVAAKMAEAVNAELVSISFEDQQKAPMMLKYALELYQTLLEGEKKAAPPVDERYP